MRSWYVFTVLACSLIHSFAAADVAYVDDDAPPNGDGESWATAYRYLQDALDDADSSGSDIESIRIGQGVYTPDRSDFGHANPFDRDDSFKLLDGVKLLGGYAGRGAPNPDERDTAVYLTVLSGDLNGDDGADFTNYADNSYSVVAAIDVGPTAVLNGVTVRGGSADADSDDAGDLDWLRGGGMWLFSAFPTIRDCRFIENRAALGGGMYNREGSSPSIENCEFRHNRATIANGGGGLYYFGTPTAAVSNCTFTNNRAPNGQGGGLRFFGGSELHLDKCIFSDNYAEVGGGVDIGPGAANLDLVVIRHCTFTDNESFAFAGGASVAANRIEIVSSDFIGNSALVGAGLTTVVSENEDLGTVIVNCRFLDNTGSAVAGALLAGGRLTLVNCTVAGNEASNDCGGICTSDESSFLNCTIVGNEGDGLLLESSGGLYLLANCIVRGNSGQQIVPDPDTSLTVRHSNIQGGWSGIGNIDADPLFVQPGTHNYQLGHGSPSIDTGNKSDVPADQVDLDGDGDTSETVPWDLAGNPRIANGVVDMGAYEGSFEELPPATMVHDFDPGEAYFFSIDSNELSWGHSITAIATNDSAMDNATLTITDMRGMAGGRGSQTSMVKIESSVPAGEFRVSVSAPISPAEFMGADPYELNMTAFDTSTGQWLLGPALNLNNSPDYDEPIGDRHVRDDDSYIVPNFEVGDYGVHWNETDQRGFVWANVDHQGDYGLRVGPCPGDGVPYGGNHFVNVHDLLGFIDAWHQDNRWYDVNDDGIVDKLDLIPLLASWSSCAP